MCGDLVAGLHNVSPVLILTTLVDPLSLFFDGEKFFGVSIKLSLITGTISL